MVANNQKGKKGKKIVMLSSQNAGNTTDGIRAHNISYAGWAAPEPLTRFVKLVNAKLSEQIRKRCIIGHVVPEHVSKTKTNPSPKQVLSHKRRFSRAIYIARL